MKRFLVLVFFVIGCAIALRYDATRKDTKFSRKPRGEMLENLFNVYDPSFLVYVWPKIKNGIHLSISPYCWEDMSVFFRDLSEGHAWAYKTADASGRYHSGLFGGSRFWLGSKHQCLLLDESHIVQVSNDTWGEFYSGDYINLLLRREKDLEGYNMENWQSVVAHDDLMRRLIDQDNTSPISLSYVALRIVLNITKFTMTKSHDISLGLCLPRSCSPDDVLSIINFSLMLNDNLKSNKTLPRNVRITSLRYVEDVYSIKHDVGSVTLTLVTVILATLVAIATIVDFDVIKFKPYKKALSFDLEQYNSTIDKKMHNDRTKVRASKNVQDMETLRIKNLNDLKMMKTNSPPTITLDVSKAEGIVSSCVRCGKYKRQCPNSKPMNAAVSCPKTKYNSCTTLTPEYKKKVGAFKNLLLSFSLKHSWMKLFNTSMANKDLSIVHGLKIIATQWIIFVHVAVVVSSISEHATDVGDLNSIYYITFTGTLAFDTLLFASGVFSAHHFFYLKSRYSVEELVNFGGSCGQSLQLLCFITNRAIRLLPSYMYVIFLTTVLSRVSRDTAVLSLPERDFDTCKRYWWRNVLYINNIYSKEEQVKPLPHDSYLYLCMQVSWYLSLETQLHMFGALLCLLLTTTKRPAAGLMAFALVLSASVYELTSAYTDFDQQVSDSFGAYSLMINRPWARAAPYFLGVLTAWLLHHMDGTLKLSKLSIWCSWMASVLALLASSLVPWVAAPWVSTWLHILWPLALLWPVIVCATRYVSVARRFLESSAAAGLSRSCYGALLLHGVTARTSLLAADHALCSSTICIWWYFAGTSVLTLVFALFLCLLVEMPICTLLRRISDYSYR